MSANHLRKDEVAYELRIRGVDFAGTADELRKRLNQCLSTNTLVKETVVNQLDVDEELEKCKEKYEDIVSLVDEYDGKGKDSEYQRISARLYHLYRRIERIPVGTSSDQEVISRKTELLENTKKVRGNFKDIKGSSDDQTSSQGDGQTKQVATVEETTSSNKTDGLDMENSRSDSVVKETVPSTKPQQNKKTFTQNVMARKSVPVYKWGVKFNNEHKQSIGSFLERVEELRRARGVSEEELFESAVDLFEGPALIWYRSTTDRITSWKALCKELKTVFQAPDYEFRLQQEIFSRMQGDQEPIDVFIAAMEGLYSRLSENIPEVVRLKQIYNNLHPQLQDRLAMFDIKSIEELRFMGRKAEAGRLRSSLPRTFPGVSSPLEPDLACATSFRRRNLPPPKVAAVQPGRFPSHMKCWNCGELGHCYFACKEDRKKFCYGCGQPDVVKAKCEKCVPKNL